LVAALLRVARVTAGLAESNGSFTVGFMTHVTCRLTAKNWDQLWNPMLGNRVSTFTFFYVMIDRLIDSGEVPLCLLLHSLLFVCLYVSLSLAQSPPSCDCGQRQTMYHIVDTSPLRKSEGGLNLFHETDDDAVIWLESTATAALTN